MPTPDEYKDLIDLLAVFTEAENRLAGIQTAANDALMETLDDSKKDFAQSQSARDSAEEAIKALAATHPEWMDGRTIKTPYGSVKFTRVESLVIPDPDNTLTLIRASFPPSWVSEYIRVTEEPAKEKLETLTDEELASIGVKRLKTDSITVKAAKVDMGKAAKSPKAKEVA